MSSFPSSTLKSVFSGLISGRLALVSVLAGVLDAKLPKYDKGLPLSTWSMRMHRTVETRFFRTFTTPINCIVIHFVFLIQTPRTHIRHSRLSHTEWWAGRKLRGTSVSCCSEYDPMPPSQRAYTVDNTGLSQFRRAAIGHELSVAKSPITRMLRRNVYSGAGSVSGSSLHFDGDQL